MLVIRITFVLKTETKSHAVFVSVSLIRFQQLIIHGMLYNMFSVTS